MAVLRRAQCDCCGKTQFERQPNAGWADWIIIQGVTLDGVDNPMFCKECRGSIMDFVDMYKANIKKRTGS